MQMITRRVNEELGNRQRHSRDGIGHLPRLRCGWPSHLRSTIRNIGNKRSTGTTLKKTTRKTSSPSQRSPSRRSLSRSSCNKGVAGRKQAAAGNRRFSAGSRGIAPVTNRLH